MITVGTAIAVDKHSSEIFLSKFSTKSDSDWVWVSPLNKSFYFQPYLTKTGWAVNAISMTGSDVITAKIVSGSLNLLNRCVRSFDVEVTHGNSTEIFSLFEGDRVSRTMLERNTVARLVGGFKTAFVVGLVGNTCSGKTCLRRSIQSPSVHSHLKDLLNCDAVFSNYGTTQVERFAASRIDTFDSQALTFKKGRSEVELILVDLAGELLEHRFRAGSDAEVAVEERKAIETISRAAKCFDSLFLVTKGEAMICSSDEERYTVSDPRALVFEKLASSISSKAICVVTEAEKLQAASGIKTVDGNLLFHNNAILYSNSPIFEEAKNAEEIRLHNAVANCFLSDVTGQQIGHTTFIINSCTEIGENVLDFRTPVNVAPLLAYTLNTFTSSFKIKE